MDDQTTAQTHKLSQTSTAQATTLDSEYARVCGDLVAVLLDPRYRRQPAQASAEPDRLAETTSNVHGH